jgi:LPXTG-site transpeptidase (sortase) family protein
VVAGHTVHTGGGAFDHVSRLRRGDRIDVRTSSGVLRYTVERVQTFHKDALADAAERLFARDGPPRLVLVSCDDWDGRRYLSNVVVVAAPVRAVPTRERLNR